MNPLDERLEVTRLVHATPQRVFAVWTDPELIVRWWGSGDIRCIAAEVDLTLGGAYRIANQGPDGTTMWIAGTFRTIEKPHRLEYTWDVEPIGPDSEPSIVEVAFDGVEEGTRVTIRHTRIRQRPARDMFLAGWIGCLEGLEALLRHEPGE